VGIIASLARSEKPSCKTSYMGCVISIIRRPWSLQNAIPTYMPITYIKMQDTIGYDEKFFVFIVGGNLDDVILGFSNIAAGDLDRRYSPVL
jgi:hypothetical protein